VRPPAPGPGMNSRTRRKRYAGGPSNQSSAERVCQAQGAAKRTVTRGLEMVRKDASATTGQLRSIDASKCPPGSAHR
jgi:hypothetical protein